MKKIIVAMAAIAAAFTMASCNKEQPVSPNENPTVGKSVITATIENDLTKAYLDANGNDTDGYKVYWSDGDNLFVYDYWEEDWFAEFTLENSSAGSSRGIFKWNKDEAYFHPIKRTDGTKYYEPIFEIGKTYGAIFPFSFFYFNDDGFVEGNTWKTEQTYTDMYIPMYGKAECTKDGEADFVFKNVGGLLRLTVKGTATISSITMQANEPISGDVCLIDDAEGNMVALIMIGYPLTKNEVTLDCGDNGVALTDAGTDFYISLPCYMNSQKENIGYSNVTITLTDTEGRTCEKKLNNKNLVIERSKITTATFTASEFKSNVPEGALPGKFSVSADKQVYFSSGNLTATVDATGKPTAWKFAANQYDYLGEGGANMTIGTAAGDVDLFGWSTAATTYGISTSENYEDYSGDFVDWGKTIGDGKTWRTLTTEEWRYLFWTRSVNGGMEEGKSYQRATINSDATSVYGMILYPDNYTSQTSAASYTSAEWTSLETAGCVFLPAAGGRYGSDVFGVGDAGVYWSSSASIEGYAHFVDFDSNNVSPDNDDERDYGFSVRLITESK